MFLLDLVIGALVLTGMDGKFLGDDELEGYSITFARFERVCIPAGIINRQLHA